MTTQDPVATAGAEPGPPSRPHTPHVLGEGAAGRAVVVDVVVGLLVAGLGWVQTSVLSGGSGAPPGVGALLTLVALPAAVGAAAALHRRAPGLAVALVWLVAGVEVLGGLDVLVAQLSIAMVAYGAARWGRPLVVVTSGISIPLGCLLAAAYAWNDPAAFLRPAGDTVAALGHVLPVHLYGITLRTVYAVAGLAVLSALALPWAAGVTVRAVNASRASRTQELDARERAADAEQERAAAARAALLRTQQTRLAREVHDVVGQSLAVILAQSESAAYLADDDVKGMRATMATVAATARQSLREVRAVLASTAGGLHTAGPPPAGAGPALGDLDAVIAGVGGTETVRDIVHGTPAPLEPDTAITAHRVLQEMLTNALKHGRRGTPIDVERTWGHQLVLQVSNETDQPAGARPQEGLGMLGMRERLASVGGELTTARGEGERGHVFRVMARIPLRSAATAEHPGDDQVSWEGGGR